MILDCSKCGGKLEKPRIRSGTKAICDVCLAKSKRETTRIYDLKHRKRLKSPF